VFRVRMGFLQFRESVRAADAMRGRVESQ